jgi:predicted PurR-regulated permease PerM
MSKGLRWGALLGAFIGFLISVLGNLVSSWFEQKVLKNIFSDNIVLIIIGLSIIGIVLAWVIERNQGKEQEEKINTNKNAVNFQRLHLFWSRLVSRGKNVSIHDVLSVGSEINIESDTNDLKEK